MSSWIAAKTSDVLPVDGTLGAPQLLFLRKTEQTTHPSLIRKMPPLNTCQQVRSALYKMNESASEKVKLQKKTVARWQNFGTFSRDDIAYFIRQYEIKTTKKELEEEEKWFNQLSSLSCYQSIISDARTFMQHLWMSPPKSTILSSGITADTLCKLCCNRWFSCEIIESVFEMINQNSEQHYFAVCSEAIIHSERAQQRLCSAITSKLPQLKYVHFALNVKRLSDGNVLLGNGNHWTYFVFSTSLDELYYGDSLGWKLPSNLLPVMKAVFESLYTATGKSYTTPNRPVLMHPTATSNGQHMCGSSCFQGFPLQKCGSACGLAPVFLGAMAGTRESLWSTIINPLPAACFMIASLN